MNDLLNLGTLLRMARDTVTSPREGAEEVLKLGLPRQILMVFFLLIVVLSALLGEVVSLIASAGAPEEPQINAIPLAIIQAFILLGIAFAATRIGQAFGGIGKFEDALALVIWLQFIILCVQVIQIVAFIVVPPLAGLVTVLSVGLFLWLLVNFIATMHGFTSLGMVFVMTIVSGVVILFGLSLLLTLLGLDSLLTGASNGI